MDSATSDSSRRWIAPLEATRKRMASGRQGLMQLRAWPLALSTESIDLRVVLLLCLGCYSLGLFAMHHRNGPRSPSVVTADISGLSAGTLDECHGSLEQAGHIIVQSHIATDVVLGELSNCLGRTTP